MTNPSDDEAFEFGKVEQVDEKLYKLVGLTLKTLKVNHQVVADNSSTSNSDAFDVAKILVFGKELAEIDRGFYVELFVSGNNGDTLKDIKYLYLK